MKNRWLIALLALAFLGALVWLARPHPVAEQSAQLPPDSARQAPGSKTREAGVMKETTHVSKLADRARLAEAAPDGRIILPEIAEIARTLHRPDFPPIEDIEKLQNLVGNYQRICGKLPFGLNHEITEQMSGENPKRYAVLPPDFAAINANGEMTDRWGTPYFFHALSDEILEIRSAGPDGRLWSEDDLGETTSPK